MPTVTTPKNMKNLYKAKCDPYMEETDPKATSNAYYHLLSPIITYYHLLSVTGVAIVVTVASYCLAILTLIGLRS